LAGDDLARAEVALRTLLGSEIEAVECIARYLADNGGKRLRPLLTCLGARAVGLKGDLSRLMCVGEMIHLGSLLHDDVVDGGEERRGEPAAWRVFGNGAAVLTGDFCLARAVLLASEEGGHAAVTHLARAVTEMAEGEVLQLQRAGDLTTARATYLKVVEKKSAALIAWCVGAGAHVTGDSVSGRALEAFGRAVGIAFQVADDVLDYGGDYQTTGKLPGTDLLERKLTLPLLLALERVPGLRKELTLGPPSREDLPRLLNVVGGCGALEDSLTFARERVAEGVAALQMLPLSPWREALEEMAWYLVERIS
jgi:octaprenyl-diphosphate synthase